MEKQESNNKALVLILVCSIIVLIAVVAVGTYSFYSATIMNNDNNKKPTNVSTAKLEINLADDTITGDNLIPGDIVTKTFEVKNNGTVTTEFSLIWKSVNNTFVNQKDLIITLEENGTEVIKESDNITLPKTTSTSTVLKNGLSVKAGATNNYTLTITYKNTDQDQSADMGKSISATIELGA